jgi:hypothetical protein
MRRWASHQNLPRACCLAVLAMGLLAAMGCAQRPGEPPFRRFWGIDPGPLNGAAEQPAANSTGLIPKLLGNDGATEWSDDPFLAQSCEVPAAASNEPAAIPSIPEANTPPANLLQVVEHQKPVSDISSSEDIDGGTDSSAAPAGGSHLDRLKFALSRDAQTPLPSPSNAAASEVARQRVEALMKNARRQIQLGECASALRWALAAEQLAARSELFFGPHEDPPADLVRSLQDRLNVPPVPLPAVISEQPGSLPEESGAASEPPEFRIILPEIVPAGSGPSSAVSPSVSITPSSQPYSTRAMQQAVIAPETLKPAAELENPLNRPTEINPSQRHARSLKVDARRVSANHGAMVTVEGQLNPPVESRMPDLPLAPPVLDDDAELPPLGVVMMEPAPISSTAPPPLPPPNAVEQSQPLPPPVLYADNNLPAPGPKRNVQWDEADRLESTKEQAWWIFPAMGLAGFAILGLLLLKRNRA